MNKQELIKKYKRLEGVWNAEGAEIARRIFLLDLYQLDEPQKVKIPQFVADWIEECKNDDFHLFGAMEAISLNQKKLDYWFREDDNMELFARAWIEGYEVEKEKRYSVKVKGMKRVNGCLAINKKLAIWFFGTSGNSNNYRTRHTRKELEEAGFGWVFDCEGIEIEEVTE